MEQVVAHKRVTRWQWQKLNEAQTRDEVQAVLAEVLQNLGEGDIEVAIFVPPEQYIRLMQLTWVATRAKEIEQGNIGALTNRAFQVYELYLKQVMLSRLGLPDQGQMASG